MLKTTNYDLVKIELTDSPPDITVLNPNFDTIDSELAKRVLKEAGKGLSSNDFTSALLSKLNGIANNANNYTHPTSHPPTIIAQDVNNRFVSDSQISTWNAKASTAIATTLLNGLMSKEDKAKLDGIAEGANNYTHPANHPASMIAQDASRRFVSDSEKSTWNAKASTAVATTTANGLMSSGDKSKLDGIEAKANNYVHPSYHTPDIIVEDATHRFVTDTEKATWNAKASTALATTAANGLMSKEDKSKLNGIAAGANNYTHPASHPASMITEEDNKKFITQAQIALISSWDNFKSTGNWTGHLNIKNGMVLIESAPETIVKSSNLDRGMFINQDRIGFYDWAKKKSLLNIEVSEDTNATMFGTNELFFGIANKGSNGYTKLPNGLLMQWGSFQRVNAEARSFDLWVSYPISFPEKCLTVVGTVNSMDQNTNPRILGSFFINSSKSQFRCRAGEIDLPYANTVTDTRAFWIAIGY